MTADPPADPSPRALGESLAALAAQVADLRGQIQAINDRLDQAGLRPDLNLAARFEDLAQTVTSALDAAAPRGQAAPSWIGLDRSTHHAQLADLRQWADTVLRQHYGGYELQECWPRHIHAVWELSTLAAEWHRTYKYFASRGRGFEWPGSRIWRFTTRQQATISSRCKVQT